MATQFKSWMLEHALPLWSRAGIDNTKGGFFEGLSWTCQPELTSRRALVQARQLFSFRTALEIQALDAALVKPIVKSGIQFLLKNYSLPSQGFIHSVDTDEKPANAVPELYTQAFALFGMANAYAVLKDPEIKQRAKLLVQYLNSERALKNGGFTELAGENVMFEANPHMHMFEAAIYWMEVDSDPEWKKLADMVLELALSQFIDSKTGFLAEHFDSHWKPLMDKGRFVFEPGHQYEWAWLMGKYEQVTGRDLLNVRLKLFDLSEQYGLHPDRKAVMDEMWSDGTVKLMTSRFWPQCERIKSAMQLARDSRVKDKEKYFQVAERSTEILMKFFNTPAQGLWYDTWVESGEFKAASAKASSLYHIIGAYAEYSNR